METLQLQQKTSLRKLIKSMSEMELGGEIHFSVNSICLIFSLGTESHSFKNRYIDVLPFLTAETMR